MKGFVEKRIFLQEIAKICQTLFSSHNKKKTVFNKELYSMSGFDAKPLSLARNCQHLAKHCFQPKIEQNTLFKKADLMQNAFFSKNCLNFGKTPFSTHNRAK